ncbi:MAG: hypothetical protein EOO47_26365 [Flavobacterium sp.]|nr:MAG: hypothetical protein EOO47_26365 [Flavobacterium sp.]
MDKKAKDILHKTYWASTGWVNDTERKTDPSDFDYAKAKGIMFDNLTISKLELLKQLEKALNNISLKTVTDAFLCSLTNKRLDWRSGLASYVNAKRILTQKSIHEYTFGYGVDIDLNIMNFERIKWGGVRHSYGIYNLLDLELLGKETIPSPTLLDIEQFKKILCRIEKSEICETASKLRDNLKETFNVSKSERHILLEILGCADILLPLSYDREEPSKHDWTFVLYWRGEDKYNKPNCKHYFGSYGID